MNLMTPGRVLTSNKYICNSILCSTYLSNLRRATRTERAADEDTKTRHDSVTGRGGFAKKARGTGGGGGGH